MKQLMTGNEALARGAWEAGVHFAAAYPGTPSTEIMENISTYQMCIRDRYRIPSYFWMPWVICCKKCI